MLAWLGRLEDAGQQIRETLAFAEGIGQSTSWMHTNCIDLAWFSGDHRGVLRHGQLAMQRAESWGSSYFNAIAQRGLALAHVLDGDAEVAVRLMEQTLPLVARGANGHQFQAHTMATLARAYLKAGAVERSWEMAEAAVASAQASHSRGWEVSAWLALLELPAGGAWSGRVAEGIDRVAQLIDDTGVEGSRPWWWLAQARHSADAARQQGFRDKAIEAFARNGAIAHVERLRAQ